ncbi:hypothetical protein [Coralloluteibacterium thermophilus]|uniref:Lipoprotein n=1 Tax=Coralloluteibacterium thermophilum TaxID=2707049 RepID=A0ABV9NGU3_9GAMM
MLLLRPRLAALAFATAALCACAPAADPAPAPPAASDNRAEEARLEAQARASPDWLDGLWHGTLYREYENAQWPVELDARPGAAPYRVNYRTLGCIAELVPGDAAFAVPDEPEFAQRVVEGVSTCLPPGRVRLMRGNGGELHFNYISADDVSHRASGTLRRL